MIRLPKPIALWLALRKAKTPAEQTAVRRKIGSRYAKRRKPNGQKPPKRMPGQPV